MIDRIHFYPVGMELACERFTEAVAEVWNELEAEAVNISAEVRRAKVRHAVLRTLGLTAEND